MTRTWRHMFSRDEDGAATVEFVVLFSFLITIILSVFESGWLMTKQMMLDRGVDVAMRDVRLGLVDSVDPEQLRLDICNIAYILRDCRNTLKLQIETVNPAVSPTQSNPDCADRTVTLNPIATYQPVGQRELKFVRACVIVDPIFPGIGLGLQLPKDTSGGFQMVSFTMFVNEP